MPTLFDPITIGDLCLPNRILMSPLTRSRATGGGRVPNALMAHYYGQRATAGMIFSEATSVTAMGVGYADTPGIWSAEQVAGWKLVTEAVHAAGGRILLQLWHVGRVSDPVFLDGALPVAPSALAPAGNVRLVRPERPYVVPRALELAEIPGVIEAYRRGAAHALDAGFDEGSRCTEATDTCWTSFSRIARTRAPTATGAASRTGRGSCSRSPTPRSRSGAPGGSGCTSPRAGIPSRWAIRTRCPPSGMSPASSAAARSPSSAPGSTWVQTGSGPS